MTVKLAPVARQQFVNSSGVPYSGAKLFFYAAGTSTKQDTFTTSAGTAANSNPIVLDSAGRTPYGVWLTSGVTYKMVLAPASDTDPPGSPIFTEDNVSGINDEAVGSQWVASGVAPTYVSATQFTVAGDKTSTFLVDRRVKITETAGTVYGYISASAYAALTTVTVVLDSGTLDSGISAVEVGILTNLNSAIPDTITRNTAAQVLTNKSLQDSTTYIVDNSDATKKLQFQLSGITTGTTRTLTVPDVNTTIAGTDSPQTFTNKSLSDSTTFIVDESDATKKVQFQVSGITTGTTRTLTVPDADIVLAGSKANTFSATQTLSGAPINQAKGASIVANATTMDVWAATGDTIHITGSGVLISAFPAAPQAGVWRTLVFDGANTLVDGVNFIVQGNRNYTTSADDTVHVYADTTTKFYLYIDRADGDSVSQTTITLSMTTITPSAGSVTIPLPSGYQQHILDFYGVYCSAQGPNKFGFQKNGLTAGVFYDGMTTILSFIPTTAQVNCGGFSGASAHQDARSNQSALEVIDLSIGTSHLGGMYGSMIIENASGTDFQDVVLDLYAAHRVTAGGGALPSGTYARGQIEAIGVCKNSAKMTAITLMNLGATTFQGGVITLTGKKRGS